MRRRRGQMGRVKAAAAAVESVAAVVRRGGWSRLVVDAVVRVEVV